MTSWGFLGNEFCRSQEIQQLRLRISGFTSCSQAVLGDLFWLSGFRWKAVCEQNWGVFTNSPHFPSVFDGVVYCQRPPWNEPVSQSVCLSTPTHIASHPAHTCWPAVYCHYNYDCQNRSTNVLIWYSGTFITKNWGPVCLFEQFKGFKSRGSALCLK